MLFKYGLCRLITFGLCRLFTFGLCRPFTFGLCRLFTSLPIGTRRGSNTGQVLDIGILSGGSLLLAGGSKLGQVLDILWDLCLSFAQQSAQTLH